MLYVKIMSSQDLPDADPWKNYSIIPVEGTSRIVFGETGAEICPEDVVGMIANPEAINPLRYSMRVTTVDGEYQVYALTGNAYVMNEAGKTIATHGC